MLKNKNKIILEENYDEIYRCKKKSSTFFLIQAGFKRSGNANMKFIKYMHGRIFFPANFQKKTFLVTFDVLSLQYYSLELKHRAHF